LHWLMSMQKAEPIIAALILLAFAWAGWVAGGKPIVILPGGNLGFYEEPMFLSRNAPFHVVNN